MKTRKPTNHHPRGFGDQRGSCIGKKRSKSGRLSSSHRIANKITTVIRTAIEADTLSEIEPFLRIEAQAKCKNHWVYQALYLLTRDQGKSKEAEQWAREWVNRPAKSTDELWKQARIAGQIQETQQQQQLIETICRQKGEPHPGALLWQIKRNLAREQWEQALAGIKRLRKDDPHQETWKQLEALCILERTGTTPAQKAKSIENLKLSKIRPRNRESRLIHSRAAYEKGDIETANNIIKDNFKVNPNGIGLERLIVPILMHRHQIKEAADICSQLLKRQPRAYRLQTLNAQCLLRQGLWLEGFDMLSKIEQDKTSNTPNNPKEIHYDTSISDSIFYSRWLHLFKTKHDQLEVWVPNPLLKLLETNFPSIHFKPLTKKNSDNLKTSTPISCLPTLTEGWDNNSASLLPHLRVNQALKEQWRAHLGKNNNDFWIGLNWHGSALSAAVETFKSDIPLDAFSPLASIQGSCLIALQKGTGSEQLNQCDFIERFHPQQATISQEHRMEHMAAIISLCDLVICDDSGPGHLASNLGVPTIVNARPSSSWHWHNANLRQGFYRSATANPFTETWRKTIKNASQMAEEAMQKHKNCSE